MTHLKHKIEAGNVFFFNTHLLLCFRITMKKSSIRLFLHQNIEKYSKSRLAFNYLHLSLSFAFPFAFNLKQ